MGTLDLFRRALSKRASAPSNPSAFADSAGGSPHASFGKVENLFSLGGSATSPVVESRPSAKPMPRPAIKWLGENASIALRSFDFAADANAVSSFQEETYRLNFPDFVFSPEFDNAFRFDLRRAALDPLHGLYVLDDGRITGFMWLVICENTWTRERYGYINNLYLAPERRGQGLADELMAQSDAFFRSRRIQRVRLTVTSSNLHATRLYERAGYNTTRWEMEKSL